MPKQEEPQPSAHSSAEWSARAQSSFTAFWCLISCELWRPQLKNSSHLRSSKKITTFQVAILFELWKSPPDNLIQVWKRMMPHKISRNSVGVQLMSTNLTHNWTILAQTKTPEHSHTNLDNLKLSKMNQRKIAQYVSCNPWSSEYWMNF